MASSITLRQLAKFGAVVVGGGVTSWWLKDEEDERSNGNADADSKMHIWPRYHLVDHLHVTLTTPPITQSLLPNWLLPSLSSVLPPPLPSMEGEAEQAQRSQRQHLQPPPLLFLSCADPFVIDNLVQDVFEKRYVKRWLVRANKGGCGLIDNDENGESNEAPLFDAISVIIAAFAATIFQTFAIVSQIF